MATLFAPRVGRLLLLGPERLAPLPHLSVVAAAQTLDVDGWLVLAVSQVLVFKSLRESSTRGARGCCGGLYLRGRQGRVLKDALHLRRLVHEGHLQLVERRHRSLVLVARPVAALDATTPQRLRESARRAFPGAIPVLGASDAVRTCFLVGARHAAAGGARTQAQTCTASLFAAIHLRPVRAQDLAVFLAIGFLAAVLGALLCRGPLVVDENICVVE